jgi:hypothetical protein
LALAAACRSVAEPHSVLDVDQAQRLRKDLMSPIDALWHLAGLFAPALLTAALASTAMKWLWWRELAALPWLRLAAPAALICALISLGGLWVVGQDGRMATYGAMVLGCALTLWWRGFVRRP